MSASVVTSRWRGLHGVCNLYGLPFKGAGQSLDPARSFRDISFLVVRPEIIGYRKGEFFKVATVLIFWSKHAE